MSIKMEHKLMICNCDNPNCMICSAGLAICTVCKGAEGELTTECCGRVLTEQEKNDIYNKEIDFKNGNWMKLGIKNNAD